MPNDLPHDMNVWIGGFGVYLIFLGLISYVLKNNQHYSRRQLVIFSVVMLVGFGVFFVADTFFGQTWGF